jgi:hypothetical protein
MRVKFKVQGFRFQVSGYQAGTVDVSEEPET